MFRPTEIWPHIFSTVASPLRNYVVSLDFVREAVGHVSRISTYLYSPESLASDLDLDIHVDLLALKSIVLAWESKYEDKVKPNLKWIQESINIKSHSV